MLYNKLCWGVINFYRKINKRDQNLAEGGGVECGENVVFQTEVDEKIFLKKIIFKNIFMSC
ncbi:hypothetical protein BIY37_03420 [Candidatus Brocadia sapporoensis]|uniref:Uncharacterized protein n=1 Tax=Candidatus Brocadia sapporoensis TaxID=392547 RepID=A0A1V6M225_9BACT|nr:hypothetical protein BIY37_03420 [Candidatus Brocadia sapporoensis]GJQ24375.1 MAG: hypothetical protein HBSAPP01_21650 [Candidatus Brocadia sapporoensis]